jgi:ribosomal-protein-alanine N-acetyltransferase
MEKMPFSEALHASLPAMEYPAAHETTTTDWRRQLPVLTAGSVTLRELRADDADSLFELLTTEEVARFISPPPSTADGFRRFIQWAAFEQAAGRYACFAVVPAGTDTAVGIFQVRQLDASFDTAEWGFVMGSAYWGTGIFAQAARMVVEFAIDWIGVRRLEARAAVQNGRGNGALAKVGAVREAVLRQSFARHGQHYDQHLWSILADDWKAAHSARVPEVH